MIQPGFNPLPRRRADLFDVHCIGRLEDRQGRSEPDGGRGVGTRNQLPESWHCVEGQRPDFSSESLPPN